MATITVNTTVDELDGSVFDGDISLRDAISVASAGDTIEFSGSVFNVNDNPLSNSTIFMDLGAISIASDLTINGDIDGDGIADVTLNAGGLSRIFTVTGAGTDAELSGLNFVDGAINSGDGGAIGALDTTSTLTVSNSIFSGNGADSGGAIFAAGELTVVNSYFFDNESEFSGGAIDASGDALIVNSTFTQNYANEGGAIHGREGTVLEVSNSTVTGNLATTGGGGISGDDLEISNSIVFANSAPGTTDDVDFTSSFVSNQSNIFGSDFSGVGTDQSLSIFDLPNVFDTVGAVTVNSSVFDAGLVSNSTGVSPVIGLAENGLAQDAGNNADVVSEADLGFDVDGDGTIETGALDRDASGLNRIVGASVDIGASENYGRTWVVDIVDDIDDGDLTLGNLSLREAIEAAQDGDTITFDAGVFTADGDERVNTTIDWQSSQMTISGNRTLTLNGDVNGDGIADVTLDGSGSGGSRMMSVSSDSGLNIQSITFANASTASNSGAVLASSGEISILNSTFTNNTASVFAGALRIYSGTATIANSTFDGNQSDRGGAIRNNGDLTVLNSTFVGNHATETTGNSGGGAIESSAGSLTIINSTITGNTAAGIAGGLNVVGGTLVIENSIVVGNVSESGGAGLSQEDIRITAGGTSNGGNVLGVSNVIGTGDIISATPSDVFETTANTSVGGLPVVGGVLGDNGGTTDTVLIRFGSFATDQGVSADIPTETNLGLDVNGDGTISGTTVDVDQTGKPRVLGESVDAGAVELDTENIVVTTLEDTRDGDISRDDISWREALDLVVEGGTITFDEAVFGVDTDPLNNTTIFVSAAAEINISQTVHIDGDINNDGIADVSFDGTGSGDELLEFDAGTLTLEGLTFQNFSDTSSGGVLRSFGDMLVLNSNFVDNNSDNFGGALRLYGASTTVIASSYFGANTSSNDGGAIRSTGQTTIVSSTFTGNASLMDGGAIAANSGTLTLINNTVTGNHSAGDGGGVFRTSGTLVIENSIIAGNDAADAATDVGGVFTSSGTNIFGAGQTGTAVGDVVLGESGLTDVFEAVGDVTTGGAPAFEAGIASDNGGATPTVSLNLANPDNPALDAAGASALSEATLGIDLNFDGDTDDMVLFDGRGFARSVDVPDIGTEIADIGAYEVQDVATDGGDYLTGDSSANTLNGMGGNDIINGGGGSDMIDGGTNGAGGDTASYANATNNVSVYLQFTGLFVGGGQGADTLVNIENLIGGDFDDRLVGDSGDNILTGGAGGDILKGKGGSDTFYGGDGDDRMTGGAGADIMNGGAGTDILFALAGNDILDGGDDRDFVYGGLDADTVRGGQGDDEVRGNRGNDLIFGEAGVDDLRGGGNDDVLDGGDDQDFLFGGNGRDTLFGGAGNDSMSGGSGGGVGDGVQDRFVFTSTADGGGGFDRIKDMENDLDVIDLTSFGFANFAAIGASSANNGAHTRLDFGSGDTLYIEGLAFANFDATDVLI